jgi:hypothetical protein
VRRRSSRISHSVRRRHGGDPRAGALTPAPSPGMTAQGLCFSTFILPPRRNRGKTSRTTQAVGSRIRGDRVYSASLRDFASLNSGFGFTPLRSVAFLRSAQVYSASLRVLPAGMSFGPPVVRPSFRSLRQHLNTLTPQHLHTSGTPQGHLGDMGNRSLRGHGLHSSPALLHVWGCSHRAPPFIAEMNPSDDVRIQPFPRHVSLF